MFTPSSQSSAPIDEGPGRRRAQRPLGAADGAAGRLGRRATIAAITLATTTAMLAGCDRGGPPSARAPSPGESSALAQDPAPGRSARPVASAAAPAASSAPEAEGPVLTPVLPPDSPVRPAGTPPATFQATMDEYAWKLFVAMAWPASPSMRGQADASKTIGDPGLPVFATLKDVDEVFGPNGGKPADWNVWPTRVPPKCVVPGAEPARVVRMAGKVSATLRAIKLPVGGTLTDQHGKLARFAEAMNQIEFDFVVSGGLYDARAQAALRADVAMTMGSFEVKSAWREMVPADRSTVFQDGATTRPIAERYHRESLCICDGADDSTCRVAEMGLVGLHLTRKTPAAPEWVWATFEQVDDVTPGSDGAHSWPASFFNPVCDNCPINTSTEKNGKPTGVPTQVARLGAIPDARKKLNATWQTAIGAKRQGSPWRFYQLIGTQWPTSPADVAQLGTPFPSTLANVTLETYDQNRSSCMGCHGTARAADAKGGQGATRYGDFSFLLGHATPSPVVK